MAAAGLAVSYTNWELETKLAIIGLIFLLTVQLQFIISRTHKKGARPKSRPSRKLSTARKKESLAKGQIDSSDKAIDPSVFSKFQKNLTQSSASGMGKPDEENDVILSLSSKSKTKLKEKTSTSPQSAPLKKKVALPPASKKSVAKPERDIKDKIRVAPIGGMFDDIKETPEVSSGKVDPVKLPPKKLDKLSLPSDTNKHPDADEPSMAPPLTSQEILTSSDFEADGSGTKDAAEITLSMAQNYYQKNEYEKSLSALRQFFNAPGQKPVHEDMMVKLTLLKGDCEFDLDQYEKASKTQQALFATYVDKQHPQHLELLEQIVQRYVDAQQQQHAVHFLFTTLNEFRQLHEFDKMDEIYAEIETAYHQLEDWPRLTQTYQNHLAIKKTLKDFGGQLDILDHLGKLLYDQGDDEGSRKCYEQRLSIENQMEKP